MKITLIKKYITFILAIILFSCVNNNSVEIPIDYYKRNNIKLFMSENDIKKIKNISKDDYVNDEGYQIYHQRDTIRSTAIYNGFYCKDSKLVELFSTLESNDYNLLMSSDDLKKYQVVGDSLFTSENKDFTARIKLQKIYKDKGTNYYINVKSKE